MGILLTVYKKKDSYIAIFFLILFMKTRLFRNILKNQVILLFYLGKLQCFHAHFRQLQLLQRKNYQ